MEALHKGPDSVSSTPRRDTMKGLMMLLNRTTLLEQFPRFWSKVQIGTPEECWLWHRSYRKSKYARFRVNGSDVGAHRYAFQITKGPIPDGLEIDHLCRNTLCQNPEHLEAVTHQENDLRGKSPTAINARKTHCIHGHEFTPENTMVVRKSNRGCRACHTASCKKYRLNKKSIRRLALQALAKELSP